MKYLLFLLILLCLSCQKNKNSFITAKHIASKIDSLNTAADVEEFLQKVDSNFKYFKVVPVLESGTHISRGLDSINHSFAKNLKIDQSFYKTDFDNNGYTDLLITGGWDGSHLFFETLTLLNYGNEKPHIQALTKHHLSIFVPVIQQTDSLPLLVLHQPYNYYPENPGKPDTIQTRLISYNGYFVEYNNKPLAKHLIKKIEFKSDGCYGTCPIFELKIDHDRKASFKAQYYNFTSERGAPAEDKYFEGVIKKADYEAIIGILDYIDFSQLKEDYSVKHFHAPSSTLIITYNNDKIKFIRDYGKKGTYGLMALYEMFNDLRFNQDWKPAKEPEWTLGDW